MGRDGGKRDAAILLLSARAHFKKKEFKQARKLLQQALHLTPQDHTLQFNIALTVQRAAQTELERPDHRLADVDKALLDLE